MGEEGREGRREICIYSNTKSRGEILAQKLECMRGQKLMAQDPMGKLKLRVLVGHEVLHCVNIMNAPCSMTGEGGSPKGDPVEISRVS